METVPASTLRSGKDPDPIDGLSGEDPIHVRVKRQHHAHGAIRSGGGTPGNFGGSAKVQRCYCTQRMCHPFSGGRAQPQCRLPGMPCHGVKGQARLGRAGEGVRAPRTHTSTNPDQTPPLTPIPHSADRPWIGHQTYTYIPLFEHF